MFACQSLSRGAETTALLVLTVFLVSRTVCGIESKTFHSVNKLGDRGFREEDDCLRLPGRAERLPAPAALPSSTSARCVGVKSQVQLLVSFRAHVLIVPICPPLREGH